MKNEFFISRRRFIQSTGSSLLIPATMYGQTKKTSANNRIIMGLIGIGSQGTRNLFNFLYHKDVQVVAISDVSAERRDAAKAIVDERYANKDCATYRDFRQMLARDDIDAIAIATGERWHGLISILAAKAGKDIYCEKPNSMSIAESRLVVETMREHKRVYQCGTQRRSQWSFRYVAEMVQAGKIGKLKKVYAHSQRYGWRDAPAGSGQEPEKEVLDWDLWTGPGKQYDYSEAMFKDWRRIRGIGEPGIAEWGAHTVDLCQFANNSDDTSPIHYTLTGKYVTATYENGVKALFTAPPNYHRRNAISIRYDGEEGWLYVDDGGVIESEPVSLVKEFQDVRRKSWTDLRNWANHQRNFLDCVRSRKPTESNAEVAHRAATACHLATICHEVNRDINWDPVKEVILDDPEASKLLSHNYRQPWKA